MRWAFTAAKCALNSLSLSVLSKGCVHLFIISGVSIWLSETKPGLHMRSGCSLLKLISVQISPQLFKINTESKPLAADRFSIFPDSTIILIWFFISSTVTLVAKLFSTCLKIESTPGLLLLLHIALIALVGSCSILIICDAMRDLGSVNIWRLHGRSNACKCILMYAFFYLHVIFIRLHELAWHSNGSIKCQTFECHSNR